jgi:L-ascorbate metabolism protein UlaG (beta-lactamase superfamily)
MIITCIGHAMFLLELDNGVRIVTDPVDHGSGYPVSPVKADAVLVSHKHHDHAALENAPDAQVIDREGLHTLATDVKVTAVHSWHDDAEGTKRGDNLMFLLQAEGLRVAHLGDLGHLPTKEQVAALAPVDVLMIPVGGYYTIDAHQAKQTAEMLGARVILPMHYRTQYNADWPIAPAEDFLALYDEKDVARQHLLRVTQGDLVCQKKVCLLEAQLKG